MGMLFNVINEKIPRILRHRANCLENQLRIILRNDLPP